MVSKINSSAYERNFTFDSIVAFNGVRSTAFTSAESGLNRNWRLRWDATAPKMDHPN